MSDTENNTEVTEEEEQKPAPPARHVEKRTVVFPKQRVLFVPVPKAGCTAILWALANVAGLDEEMFHASFIREVSRSLTIHDLGRWPEENLFAKLEQDERDEVLKADDWFRFTVVRHPFRRLWSAWQSKILLAEPQFVEKFSERPWFPTSFDSAGDILKMFRQFVEALEEDPELVTADVHWAPQVAVIAEDRMPYTHIGRIESLEDTTEKLRAHLEPLGASLPELGRANPAPLPYSDHLFEEAHVRILTKVFEADLKTFGYEDSGLEGPTPDAWTQTIEGAIPGLKTIRQRNERVGDLQQTFLKHRHEMNTLINNERRRNKRLEGRLRETLERLRTTRNELAGIRNSASWRYTRPLRRFQDFRKKTLRRFR